MHIGGVVGSKGNGIRTKSKTSITMGSLDLELGKAPTTTSSSSDCSKGVSF